LTPCAAAGYNQFRVVANWRERIVMAEHPGDGQQEAWRREITERIQKHVAESSCRLNPDPRITSALIEGLVRRKGKFGDYYCPCRVVTGSAGVDCRNVCPCETHEAEIAETGKCHCGLYVGPKT
jgi:ferredoxin-thioredoxin reductase catalytic subunit